MSGILLAMFGAGGAIFSVGGSILDNVVDPNDATATRVYGLDGKISDTVHSGTSQSGSWVNPNGAAPGGYTVRAHVVSGSSPSGSALDTDLALTSSRSWTIARTTIGTTTSTLTITIKDAGGVTVASGNITLTATIGP